MIMIRFNVIFFAFILAVSFSSASAETYTWTDEQGTMHFTEDLGTVPEKIRKTLRKEEMNSAPEEEPPSQVPSAKAPEATLQATPGGDGDNGIYDGKTSEQWQKELAEREAAMEAVRSRIVEIADQRKSPAVKRSEQDKLFAEQKSLQAQFNDMKAQYFQLVESARKAGLTVNIQQ
jgi:hypothetical protein